MSLATTAYDFKGLCHTSAKMQIAHRATVDIKAEATKRVKNVPTEEKMWEWQKKRPNKSTSWTVSEMSLNPHSYKGAHWAEKCKYSFVPL